MDQPQKVEIAPRGFARGAAVEVTTVSGASFTSYNDGDGPGDDSVAIATSALEADTDAFVVELPAASITVFTLRPPC
jgi:hypothetical protein